MNPMLDQVEERFGARPKESLVDGGFSTREDITAAEKSGTTVFAPVKEEEKSAPVRQVTADKTKEKVNHGHFDGNGYAKLYNQAIAEFRTVYTSEVVEPLRAQGIEVTHDFDARESRSASPDTKIPGF